MGLHYHCGCKGKPKIFLHDNVYICQDCFEAIMRELREENDKLRVAAGMPKREFYQPEWLRKLSSDQPEGLRRLNLEQEEVRVVT